MKRLLAILFAACMAAVPVSAMAQDANAIMAQFNNEPTIEATQQAAIAFAGLSSERLEGMYDRAGGARALPKILSYEFTYRDQDRDQPQKVITYANGQTDTWTQLKNTTYKQDTDYLQHKVKAQWDLSGLVFNSEQLRVVSQMSNAAKTRDTLLKNVTKAYFARRKAQIDLITNPPKDVAGKLNAELKIQELTATLDAMTGGWFTEQLKK